MGNSGKSEKSGCWSGSAGCLVILGLILALPFLADFYDETFGLGRHRESDRKLFPNGEVLTEASWYVSGFQGSDWCNQIYFQKNESSPREELGPSVLRGDWKSHTIPLKEARLVEAKGNLLLTIVGPRIFKRTVQNGKSTWWDITWGGDPDASAFVASFFPSDDPQRNGNDAAQVYLFDRIDEDQNLLIKKRSADADARLPEYMVFSSVTYGQPKTKAPTILESFDWKFDVERTRALNSTTAPASPDLTVDVSIIKGTNDSLRGGPSRVLAQSQPETQEIFAKSFAASSTKWQSCDYTDTEPMLGGSYATPGHVEFLFGFKNPTPDSYTFCWRGKPLYGTQYPEIKLNEWKWISTGGSVDATLVFFRVRKSQ